MEDVEAGVMTAGQLFSCTLVDVEAQYFGPVFGESVADSLADALGTTGDDNGFPLILSGHEPTLSFPGTRTTMVRDAAQNPACSTGMVG